MIDSKAPYVYFPDFLTKDSADDLLVCLTNEVSWLSVTEARREAWMNDFSADYTYGSGAGQRTYKAQPWHVLVNNLRFYMRSNVTAESGIEGCLRWDGCFLNYYANEKNALGWHSDDDPKIDHTQSIAVVSLGAERVINFRQKGQKGAGESLVLGHGSLLLMLPGMQQTHNHKIPRHNQPCPPRVSLTYRGLVTP